MTQFDSAAYGTKLFVAARLHPEANAVCEILLPFCVQHGCTFTLALCKGCAS